MSDKGTHACAKCGEPVRQVDLYGTAFFTHKPRRECLTWWHINQQRNLTHQAVPGKALRDHVAEADALRKQVEG